MKKFKSFYLFLVLILSANYSYCQCVNESNIYSFVYNGKTYEVIKENKTWIDAALCAEERGGVLAEINDVSEQNAIFTELITNANIIVNQTVAPDGGGGSYVWIGGNDLASEGNWVWDGDNSGSSTPFWIGTQSGNPVNGLYNNWGNEPDNWNGQDALGLSLNGWPLGVASQWNDVDHTNTLYYVIEHATILSNNSNLELNNSIKLFPNPVLDYITIETRGIDLLHDIVIYNAIGKQLATIHVEKSLASKKIDLSNFNNGIYFFKIYTNNGNSVIKKIIK